MSPADRDRVTSIAGELRALGLDAFARVLLAVLDRPHVEIPEHLAVLVLALRYVDSTSDVYAGRVSIVTENLAYLARTAARVPVRRSA